VSKFLAGYDSNYINYVKVITTTKVCKGAKINLMFGWSRSNPRLMMGQIKKIADIKQIHLILLCLLDYALYIT
jgi:hypothetical protein